MVIAGSQASGVFEYLADGSTVKAMHAGWAAHAGLVAADFAAVGMSGPATIFEGRFGLFRTYAGDAEASARLDGLLRDLGSRWHLPDASFKRYPCCHYIHSFLECAEAAMADGVRPVDVRSVECFVPEEEMAIICDPDPADRKRRPRSGYEARFSLPVCVAAVLGGGGRLQPELAAVDPAVLALADRVHWTPWAASGFPERYPARMRITTVGGLERTYEVDDVQGSLSRPLSSEEVTAKFIYNAAPTLGEAAALSSVRALRDIAAAKRVRAATAPLRRTAT
jgi:2-methylcitrate dehydratase PrpD